MPSGPLSPPVAPPTALWARVVRLLRPARLTLTLIGCFGLLTLYSNVARGADLLPKQRARIGLEDVSHPSTLFFLRVFDPTSMKQELRDTSWGRLKQHPEIAEFLDLLLQRKERFFDEVSEESQLDRDTCISLLDGQFSISFRGFANAGEATRIYFGLNFPTPPDRDKLFQVLKAVARRGGDARIPSHTSHMMNIKGIPILTLPTPEENRFALLGNLLVFTRDLDGLKEMIERYRRRGPGLAHTELFRSVQTGTDSPRTSFFLFFNTSRAMPILMRLTNHRTVNLLESLGLPSAHGLGLGASFVSEGMIHTGYVHAPGKRSGILNIISFERGAEGEAASLPEDAMLLMAANVNLTHTYREVPRLIDALEQAWITGSKADHPGDRDAGQPVLPLGLRALLGTKEILGVPAEDVLHTLGDAMVLVPGPAGMAIRFDQADADAFEKVVKRMEEGLEKLEGVRILASEFSNAPEGDLVIRYYNQSGQPIPLAPSYVRVNAHTIMVSTHPQVLKAILRHPVSKTVAESADFQRVMTQMPKELGFLFYVDSTESYARVYDALLPFLNAIPALLDGVRQRFEEAKRGGAPPAAQPANEAARMIIDPGVLPPGNECSKYFFGSAVGVRNSPAGLTATAYSPLGLGGIIAYGLDKTVVNNPATMSVAAGLLMHTLGLQTEALALLGLEDDAPAEEDPAPARDQ